MKFKKYFLKLLKKHYGAKHTQKNKCLEKPQSSVEDVIEKACNQERKIDKRF